MVVNKFDTTSNEHTLVARDNQKTEFKMEDTD